MSSSYGTIAEAAAYHEARGNAVWAGTGDNDAKQAALLRASVWIDNTYRVRFSGRKSGGRSQEREWPRTGAVDAAGDPIPSDEVPAEIEDASYEAALRELVRPGSLAPDFDGARQVKSERQKVGQIEEETEYAEANAVSSLPVFAIIDGLLSALLTRQASNVSVSFLSRT